MKFEIYTDGSSKDNGSPSCVAGWSAVFFLNNKKYIRYGHLPAPSSNNRGEIMGVLYTILRFKDKSDWDLHIYSDSQYVVKSINEWRFNWAKNKYSGVKNADLLIPLFKAWDQHGRAKISWVKGHNGDPGNELADEYAGLGCKNVILPEVNNEMYDIKKIDDREILEILNA